MGWSSHLAGTALLLWAVVLVPAGSCQASDADFSESRYLEYLQSDKPQLVVKAVLELGAHQSSAGLKTLIELRNMKLLADFVEAVPRDNNTVLTDELQQIIISRFDDPALREPLVMLVHLRRYTDERLFNLLYTHALDHRQLQGRVMWVSLLLSNNIPGVEDRVAELYTRASEKQRLAILAFLSERRHEPSLALFLKAPEEFGLSDKMAHIHWLIGRMDTSRAAATLVRIISAYRSQSPTEDHYKMVTSALMELNRMGRSVLIDSQALVHSLPYKDQPLVARAYAELVANRGMRQASDDMYALLHDRELHRPALDAILAMTDKDISRKALQEVQAAAEENTYDQATLRHYTSALHGSIENHDNMLALRDEQRILAHVSHEMAAIWARHKVSRTLPSGDVRLKISAYMKYLGDLERLDRDNPRKRRNDMLSREIFEGHTYLAHLSRNLLHEPREAIRHYEMANSVAATDPGLDASFNLLMIAETMLFELDDKSGAISYYEKFRQALASSRSEDFSEWTLRWASWQLNWLRDGKQFSGTISRDNLRSFALTAALLPGVVRSKYQGLDLSTPEDRERLLAMPRSHILIPFYLDLARYLPAEQVSELLAGSDPSGFWRAHVLGMIEYERYKQQDKKRKGSSDREMTMAAAMMRRLDIEAIGRILDAYPGRDQVSFSFGAEPWFATPEQTFDRFRTALRQGDVQTAVSCFSPDQRSRMRDVLGSMSARQMADSAATYQLGKSSLDMGNYQEYDIQSQGPNGHGSVIFTNIDGEWKINQL